MKQAKLIQEITPEQVASIDTLKGKQLHITLDELSSIGSILIDYNDVISKFIEDNMATNITIQIKPVYINWSNVTVVIISIDNTFENTH